MTEQTKPLEPGDLVLLTINKKYEEELGTQKLGIVIGVESNALPYKRLIELQWLCDENMYPRNKLWPEQTMLEDVQDRLFQFQVIR